MCYSSRLPSALAKWLQPRSFITSIKIANSAKAFPNVLDNLFVTLAVCESEQVPQVYGLSGCVETTLRDALSSGHLTLAKWIMCRQKPHLGVYTSTALWSESIPLMNYFPHAYLADTAAYNGFISDLVRKVPTTFTVSYILRSLAPHGCLTQKAYTELITVIASEGHLDLFIYTVETIIKREVCYLCKWGMTRGYVKRCIHTTGSFSIGGNYTISAEMCVRIKKLYPWLLPQ